MENASKALIIAGAILLSILIISLGIMIFNQARNALDTNQMDAVAIQQFNEKFTQYEGDNIRGGQVNSLLQSVVANNMQEDDDARKVEVDGAITLDQNASSVNKVPTGAVYNVSISISDNGSDKGLVNKITITKK